MDLTSRFEELILGPPDAFRLDLATLLVAGHANPRLDIDAEMGRLDGIATDVRRRCAEQEIAPDLESLLGHLFETMNFQGATGTYYDPRNSLLDQVLDRRVGIPITLSVVVMEVGRRLGLRIDGVGMPAHFLARHLREDGDPVFIDSFNGGTLLDPAQCVELFRSLAGPTAAFDASYLAPVPPRLIVVRILNNLKAIHRSTGDQEALEWILRLRSVFVELAAEQAELAALLAARGRFLEAALLHENLASRLQAGLIEPPNSGGSEAQASRSDQVARHLAAAARLRARLN